MRSTPARGADFLSGTGDPARTRPCYYHFFRTFNQGWWVQIENKFITLTPPSPLPTPRLRQAGIKEEGILTASKNPLGLDRR